MGNATGALVAEVASRDKDIRVGVDALIEAGALPPPAVRLGLRPPDAPLDVDDALCRAMVEQMHAEIGRAMQGQEVTAIHLFAAASQAVMMLFGRAFKGMPPVQLYEWDGNHYAPSLCVPASVL
jgi:hypothetical protein